MMRAVAVSNAEFGQRRRRRDSGPATDADDAAVPNPPTISASRCRAKGSWGSALSPSYLHRSGGCDRLAAGPRYRHSISTRHLSHGERLVALALLTVVVVTPIGEEMLFRGFLFRG